MIKKIFSVMLAVSLLTGMCLAIPAEPDLVTPSAVLMDAAGGNVLYEKNAHERLHPASVTKIMSLLLAMEAIEDGKIHLDDVVTVSEHAASMGGSQVYLEQGEKMVLDDLLKSVAVASANDACTAVGEYVAGSEEGFVALMNARAAELGMQDTHFVNCTGLDAEGHMTTAFDIALMSRELLSHDLIRRYTTIWMDTIRGGEFGLTNTNKLVRSYNGITGLKTGFTNGAGFCISATAERDGMELIAVIMKGETSKGRNADAAHLLDFGFANYGIVTPKLAGGQETLEPVPVRLGVSETVPVKIQKTDGFVLEKAEAAKVQEEILWNSTPTAPVEAGQTLGYDVLTLDGKVLARVPIVAAESVDKKSPGGIFRDLLANMTGRGAS